MIRVQSPLIGNALRERLALAGAGALSMEADQTIVPVAIVADVTDSVRQDRVFATNYRLVQAVAANFARAAFDVVPNTALQHVALKKLYICVGSSQTVFIGFPGTLIAPTTDTPPQRTRFSTRTGTTYGRMVGDVAAAGAIAAYGYAVYVPANTVLELTLPGDGIIIDDMRQGAQLVIHGTVLNTFLMVSAEWEEVYRVT